MLTQLGQSIQVFNFSFQFFLSTQVFKFFKGCLPQILLGLFLTTLSQSTLGSGNFVELNSMVSFIIEWQELNWLNVVSSNIFLRWWNISLKYFWLNLRFRYNNNSFSILTKCMSLKLKDKGPPFTVIKLSINNTAKC